MARSFELVELPGYLRQIINRCLDFVPVRRPAYPQDIPNSAQTCFEDPEGSNWYLPALISPSTIGSVSTRSDCLRWVIEVLQQLEPDDYVRYLLGYYEAGLSRFGDDWRYADITTVLASAGQFIQPQRYLEIGVRRGRSMAMIAAVCPYCHIVGFDLWVTGYGGAENPGESFVRNELHRIGYKGQVELISGNSHKTVPTYFKQHRDMYFDLITVDGDHSKRGAGQDLRCVLPRLRRGGCVVFDDISHPSVPFLADVWDRFVVSEPRFATWEFTELGYGVGIGIRL